LSYKSVAYLLLEKCSMMHHESFLLCKDNFSHYVLYFWIVLWLALEYQVTKIITTFVSWLKILNKLVNYIVDIIILLIYQKPLKCPFKTILGSLYFRVAVCLLIIVSRVFIFCNLTELLFIKCGTDTNS